MPSESSLDDGIMNPSYDELGCSRMKPGLAIDLVKALRERGHEAYFVGGCVRDMVMEIEPADYDIATSARPEEITGIFPRTETIGAQFGVVLVIHRGHPFEVATFRSDEAYIDGRRPTGVVFTDARQDVLRRDFTINGLLYDPLSGEIIDYVNGRADIDAKIVRAIGDPRARFEEDKLRILRAVRFGARLGYAIEPATWDAARSMAQKIHQVSKERIRDELSRILTEGQAARGMQMLEDSGLRAEILPELEWSSHLVKSLEFLKSGANADFAMAVLLHHTPVPVVETIVERLKFSRSERHHIVALVENLPRFSRIRQLTVSSLKRFIRVERFEDHCELSRIHAEAAGEEPVDWAYAVDKRTHWSDEELWPPPLMTGNDLIAMGFPPGPHFKEILTRVEDEQLEGRLTSHEDAMEYVRRNFV